MGTEFPAFPPQRSFGTAPHQVEWGTGGSIWIISKPDSARQIRAYNFGRWNENLRFFWRFENAPNTWSVMFLLLTGFGSVHA
jgi:hypothetical protein